MLLRALFQISMSSTESFTTLKFRLHASIPKEDVETQLEASKINRIGHAGSTSTQRLAETCTCTNLLIKTDKALPPDGCLLGAPCGGEGVGRSGRKEGRKRRNEFNLSVHRKSMEIHNYIQKDKR